jgi:uncharacterized protein (TIGR03437 family)
LFFFSLLTPLSAQVIYLPTIQVVTGDSQVAMPNTTFNQTMMVQAVMHDGTPIPGVEVTFTLPAVATGVPGAQFTGPAVTATATTNSLGFAWSPRFAAGPALGSFTGVAAGAGIGLPVQFKLTTGIVRQPAQIMVAPQYLEYSMVIGEAAPPPQTLSLLMTSGEYWGVASTPWIKLTPKGLYVDVAVDPAGLGAGRNWGVIAVNGIDSVLVRFEILAKPAIFTNAPKMAFQYSQGAATVPLTRSFQVAASVRSLNLEVKTVYNSPTTGNWLSVASRVGMATPFTMTVVVDPRGLAPGTYLGTVQLVGEATNSPFPIPVTLVVAPYEPPSSRRPQIISFANAASFLDGATSAGQLVRLAGDHLSCPEAPAVLVDGDAAQILSAGDREIRLVVPDSAANKDRVAVTVACGDAASEAFTVPVAYAAPALFAVAGTQALGYNEDLSLNGVGTPALRGSVVTLYGTGFGGVDDAEGSGRSLAAPVSVLVAGEPAEVLSASPASGMPGVVRLSVRVPASVSPGRAVEFQVMSGLEKAQAVRTIAVQ